MSKILIDEATVKLALEALEFIPESGSMLGAQAETKRLQGITALREALAEQPAQPAVPDAIGPNEDELPSYAAGWNDCRALMLEMRKP